MAIERQNNPPQQSGIPVPARVALGALAVFGALSLAQWTVGALVGFVKFVLVVVVVVAVGAWIVGSKSSR